jgi:hypothetical protein
MTDIERSESDYVKPEPGDTTRPDPVEVDLEDLPEDPHEEAYENRQEGGPEFSDGTIPTPGTIDEPLMYVDPEAGETPEPGATLELGEYAHARRGADGRGTPSRRDDDDTDADDGYDPADYSVEEVNDYVRDNPEYAAEIASLERAGKGRKGILDHIG